MISDGGSRIPLSAKNVSGNVNDKKSFYDITIDTLPTLQGIYKDLKYIVGDNALCTGKIINSVKAKGMDVVSRLADHSSLSKECFEKGKGRKLSLKRFFLMMSRLL